ncbi:PTS modulated transcriptional regulator, MtlR family protein [Neobacillus bataviensis LMG 21833]|uniref:PTS modulated transcriptional regulator, MtlR family protein n=1 Tax=Neobacillus bataviensis LMG 21833 TaxID=1117379 RepID=K6CH76_9BACI|nr:BglG family transcription antiterminator [Neobacillus bataviensis]EKN70475.1 PTS modulated transcriptional regulator, MtlR family protein [Neobacillus bataviensis LMG 21833]
MYISARERQILEILLKNTDETTVKDLADQIGVSARTIHRDLKNVEDILVEYNLSLQKKSGVGVQITGDTNKIQELELYLFNLSHTEYTPEERQTIILCELLETNEPVKLLGLANDLNVTIATVSADLTKLEERLQTIGLALIRRRGYGVEIAGDESSKRRAMSNLISEYLDESEILSLTRENIQKRGAQQIHSISERLMGLVEKKKLVIVEKIVNAIVQELPFSMADSAYIGLVVHVALAVERIQKGEGITINQTYLEDQKETKEYKFAEQIVTQLEQIFTINIPEAEVAYITMHLKGAKVRHDNEYLNEETSLEVAVKTKKLIEHVSELTGMDLSANHSLFEGLVTHLKPAIYRMKQKMGISNPLLDKIERDYADLFSIVKQAATRVFHHFYVPDEETGYLVMHFGAAIMGNRELVNFRTLVVCSSGIGTSKMLATRLQREFPELKAIQNVSVMEFKKMNKDQYQLVLSTIPIPDYEAEYIVVNPFLNKDEIEKIRSFINEYKIVNNSEKQLPIAIPLNVNNKSSVRLMEEMQHIRDFAGTIATILKGFEVNKQSGHKTIDEILSQVCLRLYHDQKIDNVETVVQKILEREKLGGIGIPETGMALYHTRSSHVVEPCFNLTVLQTPLTVAGMDENDMEMIVLVLLLSPANTSEKVLEVLSFISTLLIENEENTTVFQSHDYDRIIGLLTARLDQFFNEKLKELRSV